LCFPRTCDQEIPKYRNPSNGGCMV
jgi:hypothetical protein